MINVEHSEKRSRVNVNIVGGGGRAREKSTTGVSRVSMARRARNTTVPAVGEKQVAPVTRGKTRESLPK